MKQSQIIGAFTALAKLSVYEWPVQTAYKMMLIQDALEPVYRAGIRMQEKIIEQYGGIEESAGVFSFPSADEQKKFKDSLEELLNTDVHVSYQPMVIRDDILADLKLRPSDIRALIGVVDFEHKLE